MLNEAPYREITNQVQYKLCDDTLQFSCSTSTMLNHIKSTRLPCQRMARSQRSRRCEVGEEIVICASPRQFAANQCGGGQNSKS